MANNHPTPDIGIHAGATYTLNEFKQQTGLQEAAIRSARRREQNPLKVRRVGIRHYVCGSDWIAFVESSPVVD